MVAITYCKNKNVSYQYQGKTSSILLFVNLYRKHKTTLHCSGKASWYPISMIRSWPWYATLIVHWRERPQICIDVCIYKSASDQVLICVGAQNTSQPSCTSQVLLRCLQNPYVHPMSLKGLMEFWYKKW